MKFYVKCLAAVALFCTGAQAFAQVSTLTLQPGAAKVFYDLNSQQDVLVLCANPYTPPPPPTNPATACDLRFNPSDNSCNAYVVYKAGQAVSPCVSGLDQASVEMQQMMSAGICTHPVPTACNTQFNPSNNSCNSYVIYRNGIPVTGCLGSDVNAVAAARSQLIHMGICY